MSPDEAAIERAWHIGRHNSDPFRRSFNVQPTSIVPVLKLEPETGTLELTTARWGLIPHWWKNARPPGFTFNARIEDAASKPMWRDALRSARCLVPAEGWYEWREQEHANVPAGRVRRYKQPYFIHRRDGRLLCFAGLLARGSAAGTHGPVSSCAIITMAASPPDLAEIHDRMPAVLPEAAHAAWLDAGLRDGAKAADMIRSGAAPEGLEYYPVSTLVNNGRADGAELIKPELSGEAR